MKLRSGLHKPDKSALPSAVRGAGLGGLAWAAAGLGIKHNKAAIAAALRIEPMSDSYPPFEIGSQRRSPWLFASLLPPPIEKDHRASFQVASRCWPEPKTNKDISSDWVFAIVGFDRR